MSLCSGHWDRVAHRSRRDSHSLDLPAKIPLPPVLQIAGGGCELVTLLGNDHGRFSRSDNPFDFVVVVVIYAPAIGYRRLIEWFRCSRRRNRPAKMTVAVTVEAKSSVLIASRVSSALMASDDRSIPDFRELVWPTSDPGAETTSA